jgi:protein-histidine pros-kinase
VLGALAAVFTVMMVVLNVLLHLLIARRVRKISAVASEVSLGNMAAPEFDQRGKDEIASLAASFNRMRRSLVDAMKMLETN